MLDPDRKLPAPLHDLTRVQLAVLFALVLALAVVPIVTHALPPLSDYINHLARMHIIAVLDHDADLARYYELDWQMIPNLMMDLIVPVIDRVVDIYVAGQIFTVLTFALILSGTFALNAALFGRWGALPLLATPLLYNSVFVVGVMNYLFGVGLALWSLAAWVHWRERSFLVRLLVSTTAVTLLYVCHLFAVGIYGLGLLGFELWRLLARPWDGWGRRLAGAAAAGLPFLPVAWLLVRSPTWGLVGEYTWESRGKIDSLVLAIQIYWDVVAIGLVGGMTAGAVWAARRGLLTLHPAAAMTAAVGAAVYLAMPRQLFGSYLADQRLTVALAFMAFGFVRLDLRSLRVVRGFVALVVVLVAARVFEVQWVWHDLTAWNRDFKASVQQIERGSKVLVAYADGASGDDIRDLGLSHAACLAIIERSALVTTAFTVKGKQVLQVRPAWQDRADIRDGTPPSASQLVAAALRGETAVENYWDDWPVRFDYLFLLYTERGEENPMPAWLTPVREGARFQLYRIQPNPPG